MKSVNVGQKSFEAVQQAIDRLVEQITKRIEFRVKATASDQQAGYLSQKMAAGAGIALNILNPGANETIEVSAPGSTTDELVTVTAADTTPGRLSSKTVSGTNVTLNVLNAGGNEQLEIAVTAQTDIQQTFVTSLPLSGVVDNLFNWMGELRIDEFGTAVATGLVADYATPFAVSNNHASIKVNSITGSGTVTFTGMSLSESTGLPVAGDTEIFTVDEAARYQTSKKWWDVTSIVFSAGITAIDYDVEVIGYPDFGNTNFKILGYRLDMFSAASTSDIGFEIWKVEDLGDNKWELVQLEGIGMDFGSAGDQIVDSLRAGVDDRSANPTVSNVWLNNRTCVLKIFDFDTYFSAGQNVFESATKDEGFVIRLRGQGGNISGVDFILMIRYVLISTP